MLGKDQLSHKEWDDSLLCLAVVIRHNGTVDMLKPLFTDAHGQR